ncbi:MAG: dihydrolipoamide acetyltransferase family protein [Cyclobacteriaceae bacterium]
MAQVELIMPKMGESIMEATVLSWLKQEGDTIEEDESVLEVATDKVDTEVPSTHGGVLEKILAKEGDVVPVGDPIAIIKTEQEEGGESEPAPEQPRTKAAEKPEASASETVSAPAATATAAATSPSPNGSSNGKAIPAESNGRFYSPLVRNIAKEEGIGTAELEKIQGSGKEGRVTKKDILAYLENRGSEPMTEAASASKPTQPEPAKVNVSLSGEDEIIEMDRMRKMIAQRMVDSKRISPHVTSFVEADVTGIVNWRNRMKNEFSKREGEKLTFTPIFIDAVVKAIKDYPMINIQVDGDRIIKKKNINIGMAVALPTGNLIVPVIHNADQYNITGLAKKVNDLANRARNNQLKPDELSGGTFSISNVGSFGNVMGTPIILQPQVGILALGAITKKPAVIETPEGDMIGIRHKMFLSHSYDHRVVDGSLGGMVVRRVADYLENFNPETSI